MECIFCLRRNSAQKNHVTHSPRQGTVVNSPEASASGEERPFTSSLTRRVLNQHLRETNPELATLQLHANNSDALSEASSASGGNRSSLSWALARLSSVLSPGETRAGSLRRDQSPLGQHPQPAYNRTLSSGQTEPRRGQQRYGRSSTLENVADASVQRVGSPLSDEDQQPIPPSGASSTYRTYTRTRSREFLSPNSSRGASPAPSVAPSAPESANPLVNQLSTVLEAGESSPRLARASEAPGVAPESVDGKSRRVSRFLRPDFYETPKDESIEKQKFLQSIEQRWEKYNPDAGLVALSKPTSPSVERIIPIHRAPSNAAVPPSPLQPLLQARQNLNPIPLASQPAPQAPSQPLPVALKPVEPRLEQNGDKSSKNSPKLTVRRQFEHLINLAAAQFQRSASPNKVAPAILPAQPVSQTDAISLELQQLEDEIKNTAAIKAQATARLDALKHELAVKSSAAHQNKPTVPAKPDYLSRPTSIASPNAGEMNGHVSRRDALSPSSDRSDADAVRFARIKRVDQHQQLYDSGWASDQLDGAGTPTDSYESSSVCSDLRSDQKAGDSGDDESVSDRIIRKSFYSRFNEPAMSGMKSKQHNHRRSITNKELLAMAVAGETNNDSSSATPSAPPVSRRSQHRKSLGRDESAESVMVRKFLSAGETGNTASHGSNFERERRLSSTRRHAPSDDAAASDYGVALRSREASVARSVKSDAHSTVTSPTPSTAGSDVGSASNGREPRSYLRTYSSRFSSAADSAPPTGATSTGEGYSSASLGRRSYYPSSSSTVDHVSSLPRRANRYSMHQVEHHHADSSGPTSRPSSGRSSYLPSSSASAAGSTSRYSSIFEESGAAASAADGRSSHLLSPNSSRRLPNLTEAVARRERESTFYGTSNRTTPSSSYFARSTSTGLDSHHHHGVGSTASAGNYATMRPSSYMRFRR